jgi:signal transduction histidine kinase
VTPLTAKGTLPGGLYVRISADAIKDRKMGTILFFSLGAALAIILTTLISAFLVHRMVVPRIIEASAILKRYAAGDFTARIVNPGVPDQLGELMRQVNALLKEIEDSTCKLQALNLAAEQFSRADDRAEVFRIAADKIEENLPVRRKPDEHEAGFLLTLPVKRWNSAADGPSLQFVAQTDGRQLSPGEAGFVQALSGLMESALERIAAFQRISEAEEKYRELFVSALEGIYRARLDGTLLEINPALAAMMGYDSVADLLTLAKGSARIKQNVALHSLVEEYVGSAEFQAMMRLHPEVKVTVVDASDNVRINCSPVHIQKVIMNLVMNAVEAVAPGGGSVVVRTSRQEPGGVDDLADGGQAVLEVGDDGPGIPEEYRAHIFEPFYTRKVMGKKGTGLGLTVVWNVSGFSESADVKAAMQLGVGGFVKKPYTMSQFVRAIKTEMGRPPASA